MEKINVVLDDQQAGELQLLVQEEKAGKMDIAITGHLLTVYHTEVDDKFAGKNYAKLLLNALVDYAKEHNLKIVPLCPYVHLQFKRNPDTFDAIWQKTN